jgi:heptosyltransferase-2
VGAGFSRIPETSRRVTRLIVLAPNWLGDAVMALPALADIQRAQPSVSVHVAARPSIAPLYSLVRDVEQVVVLDGANDAAALRAHPYDTAILLTNSFKTALLARRAGIRERWGYRADFRSPLLTRAVMRPVGVHQAEYYQQLARALGFASGPLEPRLDLPATVREQAADLLRGAGWDGRSPLVAVAPGAAYGGAKRWPARSFAEVARTLSATGTTPVLVGAAADAPAGAEVVAAIGDAVAPLDLIGRTDLRALGGVLVQCRALLTNDSGAMHFAAALGTRVVALFGPTNERETSPLGRGDRVVLTHDVWCRPCMQRECPLTHGCMRGISTTAVYDTVRITIRGAQGSEGSLGSHGQGSRMNPTS